MEDHKNLPDEGDIVLVNVKQVTNHGAYVSLEEYGNITGFLHISEIATGWIRNIERYVRPNQKIVLKVIRVNKARSEVDLSLKQVSGEEKKSKIIEVKKNEKANAFMAIIKSKANLSNEQIKHIEDKILTKYDYVYDIFEATAKKGKEVLLPLELNENVANIIEEESKKISIPHVEIRGILEVSSQKSNGVEIIKSILSAAEITKGNARVIISYIAAPKYRIVVAADNFKVAEKAINNSIEKIKFAIEKEGGNFNFIRQESKKTQQQLVH
jgi:translation initiation factor 2 subunit 1